MSTNPRPPNPLWTAANWPNIDLDKLLRAEEQANNEIPWTSAARPWAAQISDAQQRAMAGQPIIETSIQPIETDEQFRQATMEAPRIYERHHRWVSEREWREPPVGRTWEGMQQDEHNQAAARDRWARERESERQRAQEAEPPPTPAPATPPPEPPEPEGPAAQRRIILE